jgi:hypothetical protein
MGWLNRKQPQSGRVSTFGTGLESRSLDISSFDELAADVARQHAFYGYLHADEFSPGTQNWSLKPPHETPLMPIWGAAFLRWPNTFRPEQPPQIYVPVVSVPLSAQAGIVVGGLAIESLPASIESGLQAGT